MSISYAGETVTLKRSAFDLIDGHRLTNTEVSCLITIWNSDGTTLILDESVMAYGSDLLLPDGSFGGWYYVWNTASTESGTYQAQMSVDAAYNDWTWHTIRLRSNLKILA